MKIRKIPVGMLQENCYFVSDENGETAVIDPGDEAGRLLGLFAERRPDAALHPAHARPF